MVQCSSAKGGNEGSTEALSRSIWRILNSSHYGCHSDTPRSLQSVRNLPNKTEYSAAPQVSSRNREKASMQKEHLRSLVCLVPHILHSERFYTRDKYSIHSLIQKTMWMMCKYDLERCQRNTWRKGETSCKNSLSVTKLLSVLCFSKLNNGHGKCKVTIILMSQQVTHLL